MKRAPWILGLALLLVHEAPAEELVDRIAAVVDDKVILLSEVDRMATPVVLGLQRREGSLPTEALRQIRSEAVQALIDEQLILEAAERMNLQASEDDVEIAIQGIAQEEGLSVEEVYQAAELQGLDRDLYRRQVSAQITKMKVVSSAVRSRVEVTDEEIEALWQERYGSAEPGLRAYVRHLLIPWPEEATSEQRDQLRQFADQIRERILATGNFAALAREYSAAPTAADGGLTVFREGEVTPELEPYVFGMPPGEVSPAVETRHGINLCQVLRRIDPSKVRLEDARDGLHAELAERKSMQELETWTASLRKDRYIEVLIPELR